MKLEDVIRSRSGNYCELCKSQQDLSVYEVPPQDQSNAENSALLCSNCLAQVEKKS